jgi:nucleoside-diphosphate-sugar epimerase
MNTPRTVLVLGAAGRFGSAAVEAFAHAGWNVLAQMRRAPQHALPRGAEAVALALEDTAALAERAAGASVVVHAVNPPYTRWERELMPLFEQGVAVAQRLGATFMLPGNVYNYGEATMPSSIDERTPQLPSTRKGELRLAMEDTLERLAGQGLNSVLIRAGDFFGSGTGSWLDLVIAKGIARGRLVYPGDPDLVHAWAYLPDLAEAFAAVAARPMPAGFTRLHFGGHAVTGHDFVDALDAAATHLGLRPAAGFRLGRLPWPLLRAGGLMVPMLRELSRMSYLWHVPHALDGRALERFAGPLPATPLVSALRRSLVDLGHGRPRTAALAGA